MLYDDCLQPETECTQSLIEKISKDPYYCVRKKNDRRCRENSIIFGKQNPEYAGIAQEQYEGGEKAQEKRCLCCPARKPQLNGMVDRFNRTLRDAFYSRYGGHWNAGEVSKALECYVRTVQPFFMFKV